MLAQELLTDRNCATCTAAQKVMWGCESEATKVLRLDGEDLKRCPRRPFLDDPDLYLEAFRLYRGYTRGFLPEEGGLLAQPHKLMRMFEVIDIALAAAEGERDRKEKLRRKHQSRATSPTP